MPFSDQVVVETKFTATPSPPPDTARIWAMIAPAFPVGIAEKVKIYSSLAEMDDDGWTAGMVGYDAMGQLLAQTATETAVSAVRVIQRETAVADEWTVDVLGTTNGAFKLFDAALEIATFTASSSTDVQIRDGLIAATVAGYTGSIVSEDWTVDVAGTTDGDFKLFDEALEVSTFTASTSTATEIRDGLIANAIAGYTGVIIDADSLTFSIDSGIPFTLVQTSPTGNTELTIAPDEISLRVTRDVAGIPMAITQTSPSANTELSVGAGPTVAAVGVFGDLDAAYEASIFRNVLAPGASDLDLDEARRWVQSNTVDRRNFLFADNADPGVFDSLDLDNLAVLWLTASYTRVNLLSHPTATEYMASAAAGRLGAAFPGSRAWHKTALAGSLETAVTSTRTSAQTLTMKDRKVSYTERQAGPTSPLQLLASLSGNTPAAIYVAQKFAEDQVWFVTRQAIDDALLADAGVNIDEPGLQSVADQITAALQPMVTAGVLAADFTVTFTAISDVPAGDLALGDFKTNAKFTISAVITPKLRAVRAVAELALFPPA